MTAFCQICNDHPQGFHGPHELRRHVERQHSLGRRVWICRDASPDGTFLANCNACRNKKAYGASYNAAAHLRRTHFNTYKNKRNGWGKKSEGRGGMGGGGYPPMEELKNWMYEELEVNVNGNVVWMGLMPEPNFQTTMMSDLAAYETSRMQVDDFNLDYSMPHREVTADVHPHDAIGAPETLAQRKQRQAFGEKDCAVCSEKPEKYQSIHAHLNAECEKSHSWDKEIICTDCLVQHITNQIFPEGIDKFATIKPMCWAQGCRVKLSHEDIRRYIDPQLFEKYDEALTQQELHSSSHCVQCANTAIKCRGGAWFIATDREELTFFRCPICHEFTCLQCNSLYETHSGRPCPVGLATRRQEEDKKSEIEVKKISKECECGARIQKTDGCDHMTCESICRLSRESKATGLVRDTNMNIVNRQEMSS
jgi:hypothetical protein